MRLSVLWNPSSKTKTWLSHWWWSGYTKNQDIAMHRKDLVEFNRNFKRSHYALRRRSGNLADSICSTFSMVKSRCQLVQIGSTLYTIHTWYFIHTWKQQWFYWSQDYKLIKRLRSISQYCTRYITEPMSPSIMSAPYSYNWILYIYQCMGKGSNEQHSVWPEGIKVRPLRPAMTLTKWPHRRTMPQLVCDILNGSVYSILQHQFTSFI